ncbi:MULTISPECIES: DUF2474 family protein [Luteibacter]|nr:MULTISPECIES: DUF2474 family protein [unclassified Luteibacter]
MDARRQGWLGRAGWFVALYVAGVLAVALIALAFRLLVPH